MFVLKIKIKRAFHPCVHEIFALIELTIGHLCYHSTDVPLQANPPHDYVSHTDHSSKETSLNPTPRCDASFSLTE